MAAQQRAEGALCIAEIRSFTVFWECGLQWKCDSSSNSGSWKYFQLTCEADKQLFKIYITRYAPYKTLEKALDPE